MIGKKYQYPLVVKETLLDVYGHVNNATYLTLFEEARWELITQNGYGLNKILQTGIGPVVLEVSMRYLKELRLRDEIIIETEVISYERKVGKMRQVMLRKEESCCEALFTFGLFNLKERCLIMPTSEWLTGIGIDQKE